MRLRSLVVLAVLAGACSAQPAPSSNSPQPTETTPPTETTSSVAPTSTPADEGDQVSIIECPAPDTDFSILCETVALIEANYVDPVSLNDLAAGAISAVEEQTNIGDSGGSFSCAVPDAELFAGLCTTIDERDADPTSAVETALVGMIDEALDPNSAYLSPTALRLTEEDQSGQVQGIGALVTTEDLESDDPQSTPCPIISETCRLVIVSTLEGSPAQAAGLEPNDQMISVEGESIVGQTFDEVTSRVRGPAGTSIRIEFLRGNETFEVTITRAAIDIPVATWEMVGDTGYLRLNLFTLNADEQVRLALKELLDAGAGKLVLDLRNNPGGALTTSIAVASEFLSEGLVLRTEAPGQDIPYRVEPDGIATDPDLPLVVIVNRGSASASEVVTGALKEAGRAVVVGEASFGKNTVQQRFPLSNGGAVKLTIARWVTPGGTDFGGDGIQPDVDIEIPTDLSVPEVVATALAAAGL